MKKLMKNINIYEYKTCKTIETSQLLKISMKMHKKTTLMLGMETENWWSSDQGNKKNQKISSKTGNLKYIWMYYLNFEAKLNWTF